MGKRYIVKLGENKFVSEYFAVGSKIKTSTDMNNAHKFDSVDEIKSEVAKVVNNPTTQKKEIELLQKMQIISIVKR